MLGKKQGKIISLNNLLDWSNKSSTLKKHYEFTSKRLQSSSVLKSNTKIVNLRSGKSPRFEIIDKRKKKSNRNNNSNFGKEFNHSKNNEIKENENIG